MKIKFWNDNGANIHSKRSQTFDLENDLGFTEEEWNNLPDSEKEEMVTEWMWEHLDYGWDEV